MARILISSDDVQEAEILGSQLAADGHEVLLADNGLEAVEKTLSETPDLVFLAEHLAVFDGCETCRMLRSDPGVPPALPIVMLARDVPNPRDLESAGFTDSYLANRGGAALHELLVRHLGPLSNTRP